MAKKPRDLAQNDTRNAFFRALTGSSNADVQAGAGASLRGMLLASFGGSKKDTSRPDTAAAAKGLGVSQRTVQRWLAGEGHQQQTPRSDTLKQLTRRARQAATTQRGRARAISGQRDKLIREGFRLNVAGVQGPEPGPSYMRQRTTAMNLDPTQAAGFLSAWTKGGDDAAQRYLIDNQIYYDTWAFEHIDDLSLEGPYGGDFR